MSGFDNEVVYADGIDLSGGSPVSNKLATDGFLYIGNASGNPVAALPTSSDGSITFSGGSGSLDIQLDLSAVPSLPTSFVSDSGIAAPAANVLTFSGGVNVQTSASSSTITINSTSEVTSKTGTYTAGEDDYYINCTANTFTVTLPASSSLTGKLYEIKNSGTGTITIDANGSETIDGELTQSLIEDEAMTLICDGSNWFII